MKKLQPKTRIEKDVAVWAQGKVSPVDYNDLEALFRDLFRSGCISGIVNHLSYYYDTDNYFRKHKKEIVDRVTKAIRTGALNSVEDLANWDVEDFLIRTQENRCALVWFAFEDAALELAQRSGFSY